MTGPVRKPIRAFASDVQALAFGVAASGDTLILAEDVGSGEVAVVMPAATYRRLSPATNPAGQGAISARRRERRDMMIGWLLRVELYTPWYVADAFGIPIEEVEAVANGRSSPRPAPPAGGQGGPRTR